MIEEEPLTLRIEALAGRFPLPPGFVDEPLLSRPVPLSAGRRRSQLRIEATFGRRGRRVLEPPSVVLRDPLGLVEKRITAPAPRRGARAAAHPPGARHRVRAARRAAPTPARC